jgi:hypothetical protein
MGDGSWERYARGEEVGRGAGSNPLLSPRASRRRSPARSPPRNRGGGRVREGRECDPPGRLLPAPDSGAHDAKAWKHGRKAAWQTRSRRPNSRPIMLARWGHHTAAGTPVSVSRCPLSCKIRCMKFPAAPQSFRPVKSFGLPTPVTLATTLASAGCSAHPPRCSSVYLATWL